MSEHRSTVGSIHISEELLQDERFIEYRSLLKSYFARDEGSQLIALGH